MKLKELEGPACVYCACKRTTLIETVERFGVTQERRSCDHCKKTFRCDAVPVQAPEPEKASDPNAPVFYPVAQICCPSCGSENTKVTHTQRPNRRHKCVECDHSFKSIEKSI